MKVFMKKLVAKVATLFIAVLALSLVSAPVSAEGFTFKKVDTSTKRYANSDCVRHNQAVCVSSDTKTSFREMFGSVYVDFSKFKDMNSLPDQVTLDSLVEENVLYIVRYNTVAVR